VKYYAVTGRIPGDDEDTTLLLGQCASRGVARIKFQDELVRDQRLTPTEVDHLMQEHDCICFINAVLSSDTPISEE